LISGPPQFLRKRIPERVTGARKRGLRFERKVLSALEKECGERVFFPQQWVRFRDRATGGQWRWCQFDGFTLEPREGKCIVFEIKLQHSWRAWWQLRELYIPVLRSMLPREMWRIECCEIVHWYDRLTEVPERVCICHDPFDPPTDGFGVHIWK